MTASRSQRWYRACTSLYPAPFRDRYREDLVQHFADLVEDRGLVRAGLRAGLDLAITIPNHRLEQIMSPRASATTSMVAISLIAIAGVATLLSGIGAGLVLLGISAVLAVAQRTALAASLRTPVVGLRRRRLTISAVLAGMFLVSFAAYLLLIGETWTTRETVLAGVGTTALAGAFVFFVVGLLTPNDREIVT